MKPEPNEGPQKLWEPGSEPPAATPAVVAPHPELPAQLYSRESLVNERVLRYVAEQPEKVSLQQIGDALGVHDLMRAKLALSLKDSMKDDLITISREPKNDYQYRYEATARCRELLAWIDESRAAAPDHQTPDSVEGPEADRPALPEARPD